MIYQCLSNKYLINGLIIFKKIRKLGFTATSQPQSRKKKNAPVRFATPLHRLRFAKSEQSEFWETLKNGPGQKSKLVICTVTRNYIYIYISFIYIYIYMYMYLCMYVCTYRISNVKNVRP